MEFEFKRALTNLDERTPAFFRSEIFAHGDQKVREDSVRELRQLDPTMKSVRELISMLTIT